MNRKPIVFFSIFSGILLLLFTLELLNVSQRYIIIPWTEFLAWMSSSLVSLFDSNAISQGVVLRDSENGFAVSIQPGCNGVEAMIVLIAAMFAFPSSIKEKLLGISIGFFAIQLLNIIRIISLFYIGQWNETLFNWAHSYIWQALIMLDVLIVYIIWLRTLDKTNTVKE
jgi:exosortase H (IPTLxxWG-CTERM-specific)